MVSKMKKQREITVLFLVFGLAFFFPVALQAGDGDLLSRRSAVLGDTNRGQSGDTARVAITPTGLLQLEGYRYPVALWVPENYSVKQAYPMVIVIPPQGASPEKSIEYWKSMANRHSMFLLAPTNLRPEDLPTKMDNWILGIKKDILERYRIDKDRVYLFGKDDGAHYAAYLGTKHPEAFAAVALVGGSWVGRFEGLMRPQGRAAEQLPFLIFLKKSDKDLYEKTMAKAYQFEQKGYPVQVNQVIGEDELARVEFKKQLFELMESKSQEWRSVVSENSKTFKERFRLAVKDFFTV